MAVDFCRNSLLCQGAPHALKGGKRITDGCQAHGSASSCHAVAPDVAPDDGTRMTFIFETIAMSDSIHVQDGMYVQLRPGCIVSGNTYVERGGQEIQLCCKELY